jgi:hypothetical protein
VRGRGAVVRHLDREHAARRQLRSEVRQQRGMIVEPMQGGVAEQQIGGRRRRPVHDVGLLERDGR